MRVSQYLRETRELPATTRFDLTGGAPFVVLSPHPDDETLGAGGLIRQACISGQQVDVIVLTDGAGSHTHSLKYPQQRLIQLRKTEVLAAAKILGLAAQRIHHMDLPDASAPMRGPKFDAVVCDVASMVRFQKAKTLFVTWDHDPHCDHEAAAAIAKAVITQLTGVRLLMYPIWGWHLESSYELPGIPRGYRLDISGELERKRRAIAAHRSQMTDLIDDDPNGFRFSETTLAPFLTPFEYFYECEEL